MDIAGLRLSHSKVKFIGTEPGELHQETITLQNISSGPKKVVVRPTKHKLFRIIVNNKENKIAPGVQISARIEYSADKREDAKDECIVSIDEDLIKIPLLAFVSVCDLRIDPEIDFGTAVANSKLLVKEVNVQNHGTLSGQFLIVDRNNLPFLVITPKCADVLPNTQQLVKIELCTVQPMVLDEMLLVRLEGAEDTTLRVKANIVASLLEVLDFSGQKLDCVRFGGTYYGTSKLDQVVLYNNSPETIDWVTVMENNALGSEVGTDLSLSSDAVLANRKVDEPTPIAYTFGLITCQPCQGILHPYNKTVVTLCFNPKDTDPFRFHKKENEIPHYREYALYVRFEALGSCDTFMKKSSGSIERKDQPQVELALTGIGFRVCLNISPVTEFDFKECLLGEKAYVISTLRNDSPLLPLCFRFPKIAHFQITPAKGRIKPGQSKDIIICFAAEQLGIFRVIQLIKFFGLVMVPDNPIKLKMQPFHQMKITLLGVCKASVKKLEPKSIPQITPAIANEPETLAQQTTDRKVKYIDSCPVTLPTGCESLLFQQNRSKNVENKAPTSKPDGRGASTRSSNRIEKYTEKTHQQIPVDPEYTYNDDEAAAMKAHKKYYEDFIRHLRLRRSQKQDRREFEQFNNTKDIGLRPAEGLNSPYPEVTPFMPQRQPLKICSTVPPPRKHKPKVKYSNLAEKPARDGLNAVPSSLQEEMDCSLFLTPQQIHQISIGPTTIDFGNVCVYSTSKQILNIVNNLPTYILIEVTADYPELRESSPLSQVVPPTSAACLPIIFESPSEGAFQKSIDYKINNHHVGRILILANVVCVALELSTNEVVLTPNYGFLAETGFRTTVRLYNRRNYPAQFSWSPILSEVGIAFFIRPDGGIVDAFNDVECEVAWHASFFSPKEGEFDLIVHHGNKLRLKCIAKLGHVNIRFAESRLLFKSASWNLTTMKTAILKNYGQHHAYFKVRNVHPVPGMTVTPAYGIVPVGGHVLFKIFFHPTTVFKFDTRLKLDIRNSKLLKLRVGGSVIRPMAEIDVKSFVFHGIYCGSSSTIPFTLINSTESPIKLEFDFAKYRDFSLNFEASADATQDLLNYQLYIVSLRGRERIKCELVFSPTDVASYDFNLPVIINGSVTPSPPPSSIPPDPYDEISIGSSEVQLLNSATPSRRVQATVLYPPLELSDTKLEFSLLPGYNDMGAIVADPFVKKVEIHNTSSKEIKWLFDLDSQQNSTLEDGTFRIFNYCGNIKPGERHCITIGFCTQCPGKYRCEIPMFINEDRISPYRVITLIGVIHIPKLFIDPPFVILNPVPLGTEISATVQITCLDYLSDCILQAEVPETETEEGNWIKPFTCQFPEGSTLPFRSETIRSITCCIIFCSFCPISVSANVTLIDQDRSRFTLPVSVSADNCLLSIYRYIALHSTDQHIVLKTGTNASKHDSIGKVILQPYYTPAASTRSSSTITRFSPSTSSFEESVTDSSRNADSKVEKKDTESEAELLGRKNYLGDLLFSAENITEDIFYQRVLNAVRTWFTLFGWPNGMNPVSIPESLRSTEHIGRDTKTIYEMLNHLSGQWLPGFTGKKPLLGDPMERLLQLHWQYSTLLTFLKVQGACLAHVKPEFLLEPEQFKQWNQLQGCSQITESTEIFKLGDGVFESVSKRSWTDLLLQIYKITVLSRLTLKDINNILCDQKHSENIPRINIEPSSSNIYSTGELVLLTWLNHHYETKRCVVWECCQKGAIPPTRWIINFDLDLLDGLVLAAVVAAYCPHLIPTHFENMYTSPAAPEQCLHNSLILLKAFDTIGLDFDIQATDISDPNPITMLMLCVYLYERLPNYRPKMTVEFTGELHATIVKHVRLQNPFMKDLVYFATIVGKEANDFTLPNGNEVVIPERSHVDINVEFTSRFLKPEQALLIFVSRLRKGVAAATTTFLLTSQINGINPTDTFKCESPCFKQKRMQLNIFNPLNVNGLFSVILMETRISLFKTEDFACIAALLDKVKMQNQKIKVRFSDLQPEPGGFGNNVFGNGAINQNMGQKMSLQENWVSEYFCEINSLNLEPQRYSVLEILYLPFHIGKSYCTILLMNEQIGEFVYCLEGTGCIPLPCTGLEVFSPDAVSNYCAAPDNKNATQVILYYKCNANCTFDQEVKIPLINEAREKALAIVGQQQMSQTEYKRRKIAGTLESSSVRASAAASNPCCTQKNVLHALTTDCTGPKVIEYTVELSMPGNFECPDKISIPVSRARRVTAESPETCGRNVNKTDKEDSAILPMKFFAKGPGRYPCQIFLRSPCDIRLYNIVCVVNPEDNLETELEVIASTHQSVIKNIPLHNDSQEDWKLKAVLEGKDFFGPSMMYIQACETSMYPLMFKPNFECVTMGKLVLMNETDGTERTINLKGIGKKPVAVDHVMIDCQVRQITRQVLMVPNYTQTRLTCKVVSDLVIVSGEPYITLKAGQTAPYLLNILPWKRGKFTGVISFVVEDETQQQQIPQCSSSVEKLDNEQPATNETSVACEASGDVNSEKNILYRVWFYLEINATPAPPEQCLCVTCAVLDAIDVIIPISNPLQEPLVLDVMLNGAGITGDTNLAVGPKEVISYKARYTPHVVGERRGSVTFHSDRIGEFWYELNLTAKKPTPISLPELQCELGKRVWQVIPLANSTIETLKLEVVNSNPGVFSVEIDPRKVLVVNPQSTLEVPFQFSPSTLGKNDHCATIIFKCSQFEEWTFHLSGVGLLPQQMDPVSVSACVNSHASVIVSFENPTNEFLLVDVLMTGSEQVMHHQCPSDLLQCSNKESVFCIPLKQNQGLLLPPKGKLDIPVIFAPDDMVLYEGLLVVQIKKQDGSSWIYEMDNVTNKELRRSQGGGISAIRWLYPIYGIPETLSTKLSPAVIRCQARNRKEETMEVHLTGVVPGSSCDTTPTQTKPPCIYNQEGGQGASAGQTPTGDFFYEIQFETEKARIQMESTIAVNFVKKKWDTETGIVTITFNIIFAPYKPVSQSAMLKVQSATGGIWRFPLLLIATEPQVDDVINIEALGLNKESVICFRLTSQTRYPKPFTAHFLPCSDQAFVVSPQAGELLPLGSTGTLFTVGFTPRMYSKKYKAKLLIQVVANILTIPEEDLLPAGVKLTHVIGGCEGHYLPHFLQDTEGNMLQTVDMQWMYEINGLDPQYIPPNVQHGKIVHKGFKQTVAVQQRNFIKENLKVITTAVSSPLKGAPLVHYK